MGVWLVWDRGSVFFDEGVGPASLCLFVVFVCFVSLPLPTEADASRDQVQIGWVVMPYDRPWLRCMRTGQRGILCCCVYCLFVRLSLIAIVGLFSDADVSRDQVQIGRSDCGCVCVFR